MPKPEYLIAARNQFASAQRSLVMAVRALQETGFDFDKTIKEVKETIGDLAVAVEQITDHIGNPPKA